MAVCPGAPLIAYNTRARQGNLPLAVLLTVALSMAAVVFAPLALEVLNAFFPWELHASPGALVRALALSFWLPLAVGTAVRALWPRAAAKLGPIANRLFAITLAIVVVAALVTGWQELAHASVWAWIAMPVVTLGDVVLGDVAGGKDPRDRLTIAYAVVLGNPAIALAVARTSYPELRLGPIIIAYVLVRALLLLPYRFVCTRRLRHATEPHTA
jgi:predicted Na+-dependent transporter